jgi:F0F1-type ATP synthase assembly protein I
MPDPMKDDERDQRETKQQRETRDAWAMVARYSEIGFIIPAAVFLGYILGWLLDRWLGTHWIYIAGVIFGAVVGFAQMIRSVMRMDRESGPKS